MLFVASSPAFSASRIKKILLGSHARPKPTRCLRVYGYTLISRPDHIGPKEKSHCNSPTCTARLSTPAPASPLTFLSFSVRPVVTSRLWCLPSPAVLYFVPVWRLRCLFRADLQSRDPETFKPLHVVNMTIKDSPEESAAAAGDVLELCRTVIKDIYIVYIINQLNAVALVAYQ